MSVVIHLNKKSAIHWYEANFPWESPDCYKSWDDFYFIDYDALVQETIPIGNEFDRILGRRLRESFTINSSLSKKLTKAVLENFMIESRAQRVATFIRAFEEEFYLSSEQKRSIKKEIKESFKIIDDWIRKANAVYSDLYLSSLPTTENDFISELTRGSPIGYEKFTTYIPGYYEFESAMFRMVVRSVGLDRIRLKKLKMIVDVPDVFDRGDSLVNAGADGEVTFNRKYIKPPRVIAMQSGGYETAGKVEIFDITKEGFKFRLLDNVGNKLSGSISWISEGY